MNLLRKSYCLLRRDKIFHLNSCQFICHLTKTSVVRASPRPSKGHFGNRLAVLLWTKSEPIPRFQSRPWRPMSSSIPVLSPVDPQNCEQSERISPVTSSHQEMKKEDGNDIISRRLKEVRWQVDSGYSVNKAQITKMVDMLSQEKYGDHQTALDVGLLLLRTCGHLMCSEVPTGRVQLAHRIVSTVQQLGLSLTVEHYNELLMCYIENRHLTEPLQFLQTMKAMPNEETYQLLLWCVSDLDQALDLIQRMKDRGMPISEPIFNALVYIHARTGDVSSARSVFETMQSAQLCPSSHTFTALLQGLAECADVQRMQKTFQEASAAGAALSQNQVLSVVRSLAATGHDASIPSVLPWMPELLDADGTSTLKNMLRHFVRLGLDDAITVLISKLPVEETTPFGLFLLQEMVKADRPVTTILSVCNLVSQWNPLALSQATYAALRAANTDLALALFEATKEAGTPIRPHYYWPLLIHARNKGEQEIFRMVDHSRRMGVLLDRTTLTSYVLKFVSMEAPVLRKLQDHGFTVSQVFSPMLWALISDGRLEAAHHLCRAHSIQPDCEQLIPPLVTALLSDGSRLSSVVDLLTMFVQSCQQPEDWVGCFLLELLTNQRMPVNSDLTESIIKGLSDAGLRCSRHAVEVITCHVSGRQPYGERGWFAALTSLVDHEQTPVPNDKLSYYMRHPRNMDLVELKCHLGELQAKKMNTRGVLRLLLLKYCQLNNMEGVNETRQELERAGHNFSHGMKAALFNFYVKRGEADKAKLIYDQLSQEPDFTLDEYKAVDFATLLVTQNKTEEAVSMLEKMSKRGVKGGPNISNNCRNLLVSTSREGQPDDTRIMLDSLVEFGYCTISNKMLGPVIKTYLLRDDIEGAVKEFNSCVTKYKLTPLQYELMCHLVCKASDENVSSCRAKELIQQVIASSIQVHNPRNVQCAFIIALADMGNVKWLEQTVKESTKEIDYNTLIKHCERLVFKDKPDAIKNLIQVLQRDKAFNLAPLFTSLLQIHCRHGDAQEALNLWSRMHETDCRPSRSFITMFSGLLESHNIPFPGSRPDATVVPT